VLRSGGGIGGGYNAVGGGFTGGATATAAGQAKTTWLRKPRDAIQAGNPRRRRILKSKTKTRSM